MCEARGLQLCSVEQYQKAYKKKYTNLALGRPVNQSSTGWNGFAPRAVDGNTSGIYSHGSCTHTYNRGHERWNVQLDGEKNVTEVVLHNRGEGSNHSVGRRLRGARVCVGNTGEVEDCAAAVKTVPSNFHAEFFVATWDPPVKGEFVSVHHKNQYLTLCEVECTTKFARRRVLPNTGTPQRQRGAAPTNTSSCKVNPATCIINATPIAGAGGIATFAAAAARRRRTPPPSVQTETF